MNLNLVHLWRGSLRTGLASLALAAAAHTPTPAAAQAAADSSAWSRTGPCSQGGTLSRVTTPLPDSPYELVHGKGLLAARHAALLAGAPHWARELSGPAAYNRLYTDPAGHKVLVFDSCKPHDCGEQRLYGARAMDAPAQYGVVLIEAGKRRVLGRFTAPMQAAMACVVEFEERRQAAMNRAIDQHAPTRLPLR